MAEVVERKAAFLSEMLKVVAGKMERALEVKLVDFEAMVSWME